MEKLKGKKNPKNRDSKIKRKYPKTEGDKKDEGAMTTKVSFDK